MLAFRPRRRGVVPAVPEDRWPPHVTATSWTVGLEEQVTVVDPARGWALVDDLLGLRDALPARAFVDRLVGERREHAVALPCAAELEHAAVLAQRPGETFRRAQARLRPGEAACGRRLRRLTGTMSVAFIDG